MCTNLHLYFNFDLDGLAVVSVDFGNEYMKIAIVKVCEHFYISSMYLYIASTFHIPSVFNLHAYLLPVDAS